uniref:tRNA (guanine(37)-N1)-methyltransferase n=1 Tax=Cacopsylla melanoneura TaxID=428564 RepID=A0A8D8WVL9_9HEMI
MFQRTLQHILLTSSVVILNPTTFCTFAKQAHHSAPRHFPFGHFYSDSRNNSFLNQQFKSFTKLNRKYYSSNSNTKLQDYMFPKEGLPLVNPDTSKLSAMDLCKSQLGDNFFQSVKGMKILDKSAFNVKVIFPCVIVKEADMRNVVYMLKSYQLKLRQVSPVMEYDKACIVSDTKDHPTKSKTIEQIKSDSDNKETLNVEESPNDKKRIILLNPNQVAKYDDFGTENIAKLETANVGPSSFAFVELPLTYTHFSAEEILEAILPNDVAVSSFTAVGHIVQCNLREELKDYRHIVGQVLLDKLPTCKTVVNKAHNIDNTYRNFEMELLAGEDNMITTHKENKCTFKMDFSKVYWNSRLSTEHERVVKDIQKGDLVLDAFAGVGPFVIPGAKKGAIVFANDLNPHSYEWLKQSLALNINPRKVLHTPFTATNKDAREFLQTDARVAINEWARKNTDPNARIRILMNLPARAVEFVQYLKMLKREEYKQLKQEPLLYLYCFLPKMNLETKERIHCTHAAAELLKEHGVEFDGESMTPYFVRNVAPNKDMYKILIRLGEKLMVSEKREGDVEGQEEGVKRAKCEE